MVHREGVPSSRVLYVITTPYLFVCPWISVPPESEQRPKSDSKSDRYPSLSLLLSPLLSLCACVCDIVYRWWLWCLSLYIWGLLETHTFRCNGMSDPRTRREFTHDSTPLLLASFWGREKRWLSRLLLWAGPASRRVRERIITFLLFCCWSIELFTSL